MGGKRREERGERKEERGKRMLMLGYLG